MYYYQRQNVNAGNMHVYISDLQGHHHIQLGVAYWYRGHYLYGFAAQNPIQPQPFATGGRIMVAGLTMDSAPAYDEQDRRLMPEPAVAALLKSQLTEHYFGLDSQSELQKNNGIPVNFNAHPPMRTKVGGNLPPNVPLPVPAHLVRTSIVGHPGPSEGVMLEPHLQFPMGQPASHRRVPLEPRHALPANAAQEFMQRKVMNDPRVANFHSPGTNPQRLNSHLTESGDPYVFGTSYHTPHDRAQYLAASAPGSRNASRAPSPVPSNSRSVLRPTASGTRLDQMLRKQGHAARALEAGQGNIPRFSEWMDDEEISYYVSQLSQPPTRPQSPHTTQGLSISQVPHPPTRPQTSLSVQNPSMSHVPRLGPSLDQDRYHPTQGSSIVRPASATPSSSDINNKENQAPITRTVSNFQFSLVPPTPHPNHPDYRAPIIDPTWHPRQRPAPSYTASPTPAPPTAEPADNTFTTSRRGRVRAASLVLNSAYNSANPPSTGDDGYLFRRTVGKCLIHGETCDGFTVVNPNLTEQVRQGRGFKDLCPVLEIGERKMVDWYKVLQEERDGWRTEAVEG